MNRFRWLMSIIATSLAVLCPTVALAQSTTAFTYQGVLSASGSNTAGNADVRFRLYDAASGGSQVGGQVDRPNTAVSNGTFTVSLDFGGAFITGAARWLEIDARWPAGSGSFITLSPRQAVSAVPQAMGLRGIRVSPAGVEVVDRDQSEISSTPRPAAASWQRFKVYRTGVITKVQLWITQANGPFSVLLNKVTGTPGSAVATVQDTVGIVTLDFGALPVVAGQEVQMTFAGNASLQQAIGISDSHGLWAGNPANWWFRTLVVPDRPSIDADATRAGTADSAVSAATADSVPWSGITGVPANVSGAFSPWSAQTNAIAFTDGAVGVGTTSPEGGLSITSFKQNLSPQQAGIHMGRECCGYSSSTAIELVADVGGSPVIDFNALPSSADFGARLRYNKDNNTLYVDGATFCAAQFCPSSATLKEGVRPIDEPLELVSRLRGVRFEWKPEEAARHPAPGGHDIGFIAEEVEKVLPELVVKAPDGTVLGMDYARVTSVAVEAIKQLRAQNEAKQREIDGLNQRLGAIEQAVKSLQNKHEPAPAAAR